MKERKFMTYICECGKEFENAQSFNGHKSHCKIHLATKYDNVDELILFRNKQCTAHNATTNKLRSSNRLAIWIAEKHVCERCGKVMTEKFGSGRFCCRACANGREQTSDQNKKRSATLLEHNKSNDLTYNRLVHERLQKNYLANPKYCKVCNKIIPYELRHHKTCCTDCAKQSLRQAGLKSASTVVKRSKNEIYFAELCAKQFDTVYCNLPMFNGWDADIIIDNLKIAVLWNGIWHYKQVNKKHSLEQVQTRDAIKLAEIEKAGYKAYIIKDLGKYNKTFVENEFKKFLKSIV